MVLSAVGGAYVGINYFAKRTLKIQTQIPLMILMILTERTQMIQQ